MNLSSTVSFDIAMERTWQDGGELWSYDNYILPTIFQHTIIFVGLLLYEVASDIRAPRLVDAVSFSLIMKYSKYMLID